MERQYSRRRILTTTVGLTTVGALAGCSNSGSGSGSGGSDGGDGGSSGSGSDGSDGSDGGGSDGGGSDGGSSDGGDSGSGSDGGDSSGSGSDDSGSDSGSDGGASTSGDASLSIELQVREATTSNAIDKFSSLVVDIERIVYHAESGDTVEVSIGQEFDLTTIAGGSKTLADAIDFPSGTYTQADIYMTVASATRADGSEPELPFEVSNPVELDLEIIDDYMVIESGGSLTFMFGPSVRKTFAEDAWKFNFSHGRRG